MISFSIVHRVGRERPAHTSNPHRTAAMHIGRGTIHLLILLLIGCGDTAEDRSAAASPWQPPAADYSPSHPNVSAKRLALPEGEALRLAPTLAGWTASEITHAPKHFLASGWTDGGALWGLTGTNPVAVRPDAPEFTAWNQNAWDASLAPDGRRLAWINERGVWVGARGEEPRLVLPRGQAAPETGGDLGGPLLWSPDGSRLLVRWAGEAGTTFGVLDVATGAVTPIPGRGAEYRLQDAHEWLGPDRILFSTRPLFDEQSRPRGEPGLAVLELRRMSHRQVASAAPGMALTPLDAWTGDAVLVGEGEPDRGRMARYWIYDTADWSRRAAGLPAGYRAAVHEGDHAIVVTDREEAEHGQQLFYLSLWRGTAGGTLPFAVVRGRELRLAWAPDGERLAISVATEEPADGAGDSLTSRYRTWIVEPRPS